MIAMESSSLIIVCPIETRRDPNNYQFVSPLKKQKKKQKKDEDDEDDNNGEEWAEEGSNSGLPRDISTEFMLAAKQQQKEAAINAG